MVMTRISLLVFALAVAFSGGARASTYALTPVMSWTNAEAYANSLGGHLVAINDAAEQSLLLSEFGGTEYLWIGLSDQEIEGTFMWSNGDPVTYTNWLAGEPNNEGGTEDYVLMNWGTQGAWDDGNNDSPPLRGIMEFAPEPAAALLIGLCACALGLRARRSRRHL